MIERHSSRRHPLDAGFLTARLASARSYDRIAGYFSSSIGAVTNWREAPDPASAVVEAPVYRREVGLWEHQKHFVKLAFDAHRGPHGARFVLADQVGLGKTLQLAMAPQLMALVGDRPVLVLGAADARLAVAGRARDVAGIAVGGLDRRAVGG